jgi:hypothetical protein
MPGNQPILGAAFGAAREGERDEGAQSQNRRRSEACCQQIEFSSDVSSQIQICLDIPGSGS